MVGYAYVIEFFIAWYSGSSWERSTSSTASWGPVAGAAGSCSAATRSCPQIFWFKCARSLVWLMFVVCILVNVGMWFERFVIIVVGLHRDFLPSSWGRYLPSYVEVLTLVGSFGLFMTLFLLFCRFLPMVAMAEVKAILPVAQAHGIPEHEVETAVIAGEGNAK